MQNKSLVRGAKCGLRMRISNGRSSLPPSHQLPLPVAARSAPRLGNSNLSLKSRFIALHDTKHRCIDFIRRSLYAQNAALFFKTLYIVYESGGFVRLRISSRLLRFPLLTRIYWQICIILKRPRSYYFHAIFDLPIRSLILPFLPFSLPLICRTSESLP